jgi:hypothetical protein
MAHHRRGLFAPGAMAYCAYWPMQVPGEMV